MINRSIKDSLFNGLMIGTISIALEYILLQGIATVLNSYFHVSILLKQPNIQLIILSLNILFFRMVVIKWQRLETGKGILFVIVGAAALYIVFHKTLISSFL
jgi:hypothetical protein